MHAAHPRSGSSGELVGPLAGTRPGVTRAGSPDDHSIVQAPWRPDVRSFDATATYEIRDRNLGDPERTSLGNREVQCRDELKEQPVVLAELGVQSDIGTDHVGATVIT